MTTLDGLPKQTSKPVQIESTEPVVAYLSPPRLFDAVVKTGAKKALLPAWKVFWLSLLAGAYLGLGAAFYLYVGGQLPSIEKTNTGIQKIILGAFGLPMGLGLIIVAGAELFTANSCYLSAAVFEGQASVFNMVYHMFWCFWGNLAGSLILVGLVYGSQLFHAEPAIGTAGVYAIEYVDIKCTAGFRHVLARGFLCNWLVCLACYQAAAAQDVLGKLAAVFFPVMAFVATGYDHLVANMFIIPFGMMLGSPVTVGHYIVYSMIPTLIGNMASAIVMISFSYSMTYGTLPMRIRRRLPVLGKIFKFLDHTPKGTHDMRDDSAHNRDGSTHYKDFVDGKI